MVGRTLGPYQVLAKVGAGGMGEVYRARDTVLDRDVALKILPESFAGDPDRLMRFEREAKTLASLNHLNIAHIHGLEQSGGVRALVMELVDGEDLSARIARGPLAVDDALDIARQVARALEAAHEAGIIHRDLKPANIKVRDDGTVKVLDFGLAKALDPARSGGSLAGDPGSLADSPTMTSPALTEMGVILGTAAYMSPEQAKGKPVDKRADIWAFGVIVYEMLTGRQLFQAETVSESLAAVLRADIDLTALPQSTPRAVRRLLDRCLERDPSKRLRDIGDGLHDLAEASDDDGAGIGAGAEPVRGSSRAVMAALLLVTAAAVGFAVWALAWRTPATAPLHLSIALPYGHSLTSGPAISPDGQTVAFVSTDGIARPQLYVRRLEESEPRLIPGTEEAEQPFFSPDGQSVAFYAGSRLFKVRLDGSAPVGLADSESHNGGAWLDDGRIVFNRVWNGGLYTVSENGGDPVLLAEPARPDEYAYVWPYALPGSRELIFNRWGTEFSLMRLDLGTLTQTVLSDGWRRSVYVEPGYIVKGAGDGAAELRALSFPGDSAGQQGQSAVLQGVDVGSMDGYSRFDISATGTLAYAPADRRKRTVVTVDRQGRVIASVPIEGAYASVSVSPNGRRAIATVNGQLSIIDLERGTATPLVPDLEARNGARSMGLWSADGARVTFDSNHTGNWDVYVTSSNGAGSIEPVLAREGDQDPYSFAPDGTLLFGEVHPETGNDLWMLPPNGDPQPWFATGASEYDGQFSPDGRLVAFVSNTSGRFEVYIQAREGDGQRIAVSANGGDLPRWSPQGDRLYFRQGNAMMEATVSLANGLVVGVPQQLFDGRWELAGDLAYDVMPGGNSFLMIRQAPEAVPTRIDIVLNWFTELERRVGGR